MLDDFIIRALLGGIAVAIAAGPLGSVLVWKRMSFFSDAISHSAILGLVIGIILGMNQYVSVALFALLFALFVTLFKTKNFFPNDSLLNIFAQGALSLGIILFYITKTNFNITNILFGDILAISYNDIIISYLGSIFILTSLLYIWRDLLLMIISEDLAKVEGINVRKISFIFTTIVAIMVALSVKIVGIMMVSSLLVIPACFARVFSKTPERMAFLASIFGIAAILIGTLLSTYFDIPTGPNIVLVLVIGFIIANIFYAFITKEE